MGLTGLKGGGLVAFQSTATSTGNGTDTNAPHPVGSIAVDSSGGEYVLMRLSDTAQIVGSVVILNSSIGFGQPIRISTGATLSTGGPVGVAMSSGNSTNLWAWYQIYGPGVALFTSTTVAAGVRCWQSTTVVGALIGSSGGAPIVGMQTTSSNASSLVNVFLSYPTLGNAL